MKIDLIKKAEELRSALTEAQNQSGALGSKAKNSMENAVQSITSAIEKLHDLNDFVDITAIEIDDPQLRSNLEYWDSLHGGNYVDKQILEELYRQHSATLMQLYRGAVDITGVTKFSPEELNAARIIGGEFNVIRNAYHAMRYGMARYKSGSNQIKWNFPINARKPTVSLVGLLKRLGYISGASYKQRTEHDTWIEVAPENLSRVVVERDKVTKYDFEITLEDFDAKNQIFLTGHWFEAYAYSVFRDQLERTDADFEIYTRVTYEANSEGVGRSKSDFDVLINTGEMLVLIECKSGKLDNAEEKSIIEKTDFLRQVFRNTRVKDFMFVLVYSPRDPDTEAVIRNLEEHEIRCLQPHELRGFIVDSIR